MDGRQCSTTDGPAYSRLFRRETARRLVAHTELIIAAHLKSRPPWMDGYSSPDPDVLRITIRMLSEAVARGDVTWYRQYASAQVEAMLRDGTPPIVILAGGELLYAAVLQHLTRDQRQLVDDVIDAERRQRQSVVYDHVIASIERRGA